ncbi:hypothetical protein [Gordonia sihwensis]|uniref:hypothetical protein n=1 Tax=Gordonia sihwensis TaxID=173559 RepID=UPI0005F0AFD8|nr:hypothetical protein [Gordonia sihwensis]KJR10280.1 hypothetical protein UG54_01495 [Gordonia sihwensis]
MNTARRTQFATATVALAAVALTACEQSREVVDRTIEAPGCTSSVRMVGKVTVPSRRCHGQQWALTLRNSDGNTEVTTVSAAVYAACRVGLTYPDCAPH